MVNTESEPQQTPPIVIKAPTYNELVELASNLQARLAILEGQQNVTPTNPLVTNSTTTPNVPSCADFRLLPDLHRA